MRRGDTKQQFLLAALKLFAENGYDSVSVAQIAKQVGCSAPALYKHYPSKKALFDAIVEASSNGYDERMKRIHEAIFNSGNSERPFIEEGQIEIMKNLFITTVSDEYPKLFREFVLSVHSKHPELAKEYNSRYIFSQYELYQKVILKLIEMGVLVDNDAEMMAIEYVSPITLWVEACSREPERKEEFLSLLEKHIRHFFNVYGKK